ncbi:hypothetical protein I7I51_03344 [Histoplasma capsulatum]|uniref:Uncharacterized protein n=1 Tax=Ajellomyces capsulatus TaxID=5037 RepID=A0A8A1M9K6_AJECA|nr:predicted protein [Histoplasma mississippiense (nom. inval.)]EDN07387.1 predicted protein [Histoplasma mississippiense (nom. inval.)]QSS61172.1 hypothetical protein I7I51_03344 [Histoplasma capsulatum]
MNDNPANNHLPANLTPQARQMLEDAYDRVLEARALVLAASDVAEHIDAHIRLRFAQEREQEIISEVLGGSGSVQGTGTGTGPESRSSSSDDPDFANVEEEADEIEVDGYFGYRGGSSSTGNAQSQTLFGSADLPIHPPLVGHMRLKSYLRERRHASLSVLTDQELLINHAVANYETIPEARRRFQHHYIGLNMPQNYMHAFALQDRMLGPKRTLSGSASDAAADANKSRGRGKGKGKGRATAAASTTNHTAYNEIPLPTTSAAAATATTTRITTTGSASSLRTQSGRPIVDILEVDGGWRNRSAGDEGYGPVSLHGSVVSSSSAAKGGGDGARRGSRRGGRATAAESSGQDRRRSARHAAGGVEAGAGAGIGYVPCFQADKNKFDNVVAFTRPD